MSPARDEHGRFPTSLHREAFALMRYRCKACGFVERLWNSRDGVTPFSLLCAAVIGTPHTVHELAARSNPLGTVFIPCGGPMNHVDWRADAFAPEYDPAPGERYFRDGIPAEARAIMRKRIESYRAGYADGTLPATIPGGISPPPMTEEWAERLMREIDTEFRSGWPMLVVRGTDADMLPPRKPTEEEP